MSELSDLKNLLRVTHDEDDALLELLIGAAARECIAYMDHPDYPLPPVSGDAVTLDLPTDAYQAVLLMAAAGYDADAKERAHYRKAAEQLLRPYSTIL